MISRIQPRLCNRGTPLKNTNLLEEIILAPLKEDGKFKDSIKFNRVNGEENNEL